MAEEETNISLAEADRDYAYADFPTTLLLLTHP